MAKIVVILVAFLATFAAKGDENVSYEWEYFREMLADYIEPNQCDDVIAYYKFDRSYRDVCFGNNAVNDGTNSYTDIKPSSGISNGAVYFYPPSAKLRISGLNGYEWGSQFSVSLWFKKLNYGRFQGLISNGVIDKDLLNNRNKIVGSWEIKLTQCGRTSSGNTLDCIGASIVTSNSVKVWDNVTMAIAHHWHHLVMTYDGNTFNFFLDDHLKLSDSECCYGDIVAKKSDVIIGCTTEGYYPSYFHGYIDEVKLFNRVLGAHDVTKLYRLKRI